MFRGDFTAEDWCEVGINTAKGAAVGAVAAGSIYLVTNYAGMTTPFASAVVADFKARLDEKLQKLERSVELARAYGVSEAKIIVDEKALDKFILA